MKKLSKISLIAAMVAVPMVASAANIPVEYVGGATETEGVLSAPATSGDVATTSYVQGAYNELGQAINKERARAMTAEGALSNKIGDVPEGETLVGMIEDVSGANGAQQSTFTADDGNTGTGDVLSGLGEDPTIGEAINLIAGQVDTNTAAIGDTTYDGDSLSAAIAALQSAQGTTDTNSTVTDGTYIDSTYTVKQNLESLDDAVAHNSGAINAIAGTTLTVYDTWNNSHSQTVALFPTTGNNAITGAAGITRTPAQQQSATPTCTTSQYYYATGNTCVACGTGATSLGGTADACSCEEGYTWTPGESGAEGSCTPNA